MTGARPPDAGGEGAVGEKAVRKGRRLIWFVGFYACSLLAFTAMVYLLRAVVRG
ncbi:hypothetical protein [uncultured Methylobacterium sp.]|uniref:hypothetical protein n=1 Tax=uncultured Methylobacterium sp. TaxID=157278 RepID=UPI0035CB4547